MINTNNANTASKPSDDSTMSEKKLTTNNLNTTESTNAADSKGASSAAAIEEDVDMSSDIEIGAVDDVDEYSIDQSHVDGGADDDLQKVFAGRPSEDYYWRTHPDRDNEWKITWTITFEDVTYLVHPKVVEEKRAGERKVRPLLLVRCVNERAGADLASQVGPTRQKTQRMQRLSPVWYMSQTCPGYQIFKLYGLI
jgi:hypothetical protein